jgi:hypothetical protein
MEILEAYDLTGSFRGVAELAGCDHHTVARYVMLRDQGQPVERMRAELPTDPDVAPSGVLSRQPQDDWWRRWSWVGAQLELRLRAGLKLDDLVADEDLDGCGPAGA